MRRLKKKLLQSAIALCLATVMGFMAISVGGVPPITAKANEETTYFEIETQPYYGVLNEVFSDYNMDATEDYVYLEGTSSAFSTEPIAYTCYLDTSEEVTSFAIEFTATSFTDDYYEDIYDLYIGENGRLDAELEFGDETYKISDYDDVEALERLYNGEPLETMSLPAVISWIPPSKLVVNAVVLVIQTAMEIKAHFNLLHNLDLESNNNGVLLWEYVYNQIASNCANYKVGFTNFAGVGCGVAAVYNLMISLYRAVPLSQVIYDFESMHIPFDFAGGYLGTNPFDFDRYFIDKNLFSVSYYTWDDLIVAAENAPNDSHIIVTRWNNYNMSAHTFYVNKVSSNNTLYFAYNMSYDTDFADIGTHFSDFNTRGDLIKGYIIW